MVTTASLTFGMLLRRHRLAAGLTQEALAERAGLSTRGVQDLERGMRQAPRAETVRLLADALELDVAVRAGFIAAAHPELAAPALATPVSWRRPPLPIPPTVLVGREREVAEICMQLRRPQVRLLTLTGPGGSGKTRLALAVARELAEDFVDGAVWVDLAPVADAGLVAAVVARALGVREAGDRPLAELLKETVAERQLLLALDNCEHVLPAMPLVGDLLAASSQLVVLATSRARLRLRGEHEFAVPPLAAPAATGEAPSPLAGMAGVAAVRLFVERAQEVAPGFTLTDDNAPAVAAICRQVEGLPLALELAAARVKVLPPEALLARLAQRLPLLTAGARDLPPRQQTMRDAIAWSYDLLTAEEQTLFRRVAVFAGGCTLEAAAAVVMAGRGPNDQAEILEGLAALVDQSLLRLGEGLAPGVADELRFTMLETIREYALECLAASGEEEAVRHAHAAYYSELAERAQTRIHSSEGSIVLNRLEAEHDNLRAALAWAIARQEARLALRLTNASWRFWWMHSHLDQARLWLERALVLPDPEPTGSPHRPRALVAAGYFARVQGDYAPAIARGEEALASARARGDHDAMAAALFLLGLAAFDQGELEQARAHHQTALTLEQEMGDRHGEALQLIRLGDVAIEQGSLGEGRSLGEEALAIWRDRADAWGIAWALIQLGNIARAAGDEAGAVALYCQSLASNAQLGDKEIMARAVSGLAALAIARRQFALAAQFFGNVAALREEIGAPLSPRERTGHEQAVSAARAGLDETAFAAAWEAGRALPLERIIAEAQKLGDA